MAHSGAARTRRDALNRVLQVITWVLVPTAVLLVTTQLLIEQAFIHAALIIVEQALARRGIDSSGKLVRRAAGLAGIAIVRLKRKRRRSSPETSA